MHHTLAIRAMEEGNHHIHSLGPTFGHTILRPTRVSTVASTPLASNPCTHDPHTEQRPLPFVLPEISYRLQIIHIDQIHPLIPQRPPNRIPRPHRPPRLIPIPNRDPLCMRRSNLSAQQRQLGEIERLIPHIAKLDGKICRRDGRDVGGDVAEAGVERRDRRVPEVVAGRHAPNLVERRVARSDDRDCSGRHARAVEGRQPAAVPQRLQRPHHVRPGGVAGCLDVDE